MKTLLIIDANLGQARAYMAKTLLGAAAQKAPPGEPRRPGYAVPSPAGRSPDLCAAVGAAGRLPLPGAGTGRRVRGRPVLPAVGYRYPL